MSWKSFRIYRNSADREKMKIFPRDFTPNINLAIDDFKMKWKKGMGKKHNELTMIEIFAGKENSFFDCHQALVTQNNLLGFHLSD